MFVPTASFDRSWPPVCYGFLRFTAGAPPADLLMVSTSASHFPFVYYSAEVGCRGWNKGETTPGYQLIKRPGLLEVQFPNSIKKI